ncbi:hypothetical protein KKC94_00805 [Patescibacteria group bacterium]|nr:hypothetical protein [Patescibacteria group bacterium]
MSDQTPEKPNTPHTGPEVAPVTPTEQTRTPEEIVADEKAKQELADKAAEEQKQDASKAEETLDASLQALDGDKDASPKTSPDDKQEASPATTTPAATDATAPDATAEADKNPFQMALEYLMKGDITAAIKTFFSALFSKWSGGETSASVDSSEVEQEQNELLSKLTEAMKPYVDNGVLPKGTKLGVTDIGLLKGQGIDSEESFKKKMDGLPKLDDFVKEHPGFDAKVSGEISLPRYLTLLERETAATKKDGASEAAPAEDTADEKPAGDAEQKEAEPTGPFVEAPKSVVDLKRGSSCVFELAGEGHTPIQVLRDTVIINGKSFKLDVGTPTGDARVHFDKISPGSDGAFNLNLTVDVPYLPAFTKEAPLTAKQAVLMMQTLEKKQNLDKFDFAVDVPGQGPTVFKVSKA